MTVDPADEERILAAADLAGRTGATTFEFGYLNEDGWGKPVNSDNPTAGTEEFLGRVRDALAEQLEAIAAAMDGVTATDPGAFLEVLARHGLSLVGTETPREMEAATRDSGSCRFCSGEKPGYAEIVHKRCLDDATREAPAGGVTHAHGAHGTHWHDVADYDGHRRPVEAVVGLPAGEPMWCMFEQMGHARYPCRLTVVELAGQPAYRLDVPDGDGYVTTYVRPGTMYAIRPCSEDIVRRIAAHTGPPEPAHPWELKAIEPTAPAADAGAAHDAWRGDPEDDYDGDDD